MAAYSTVDIASVRNAGSGIFGADDIPVGEQTFQGLPFSIGGSGASRDACLLAAGPGHGSDPASIAIRQRATYVIFAHRLLESRISKGGPIGEEVGEYVFHLGGGESHSVKLRERFEICTVPSDGGSPFLAFPDFGDALPPRWEGRWSDAGRRQMEVARGAARWFVLWPWKNPSPDKQLESVEIRPGARVMAIGGITLSSVDEDPICREGLRDVVITLPKSEDADKPFNLEVEVDRGVATYPYPLPEMTADEFVNDDYKGWGEPQNEKSSPSQVEIAASPSATVSVKQSGETLGEVNWGELLEKGKAESGSRVRVEVVDGGRNWVHTKVVDDNTGKPVPCRVHFRSLRGVAYAPHGHHAHVNSNNGTWHFDVGGDMRLGQASYAYIDGTCQGWLPRGEVIVDVARGFEYEPIRQKLSIADGQRELELRLKRWCHMAEDGWYSGDSHVHFLSAQGSHTEANGEDLNVVNMLQSQWGTLFTDKQEFTGGPSVSDDGKSIVYVSQENRQHFLGHLILWGLKEPVMPWCSDGPSEAEMGGTLEVTMSDWADQTHAQGGTVVIPHLPNPNGEPATLIATGRADAVEMLRHAEFNHHEYYRYLNCGYKLPLVGGTDKMSSDVPVGIYRTYARLGDGEEFNYDTWCKAVTAGRTVHSGGPMLKFSVDGNEIGDTVTLAGNGGTVEVEAEAECIFPIHCLQVVQEGRVVAEATESAGARKLNLKAKVKVAGHSWLAARVAGPQYESIPHYDGWGRGIFAHTSPVYIACGGEWWMFDQETATYMLTLVDGCIEYIGNTSRQHKVGTANHHHGEPDHQEYLERPFLQAREAIHKRMHRLGVPH